jgi:hypothetical protein
LQVEVPKNKGFEGECREETEKKKKIVFQTCSDTMLNIVDIQTKLLIL